ncbi:hypothetical protein COT62_01830 [Candidatus Roizmanbacteria bacterium CG09_land_8_20_14_0_10_41_9]|uniref:Glycosyltransferase subfamily 4-like N-terminal domain-containing protein n=1 Tax=Candidatus Roizmanbacteria bacterium CG09_land_8_20_14_0_10_41_9 TaxID=1974850 RepID=A0A2H0WT58_9BACT|nr:MAG: hypothetical protein COT62_01830 [Candidatus Roizmanbacteria bacterium CG09_land_8_20_14_0_10_41_9]
MKKHLLFIRSGDVQSPFSREEDRVAHTVLKRLAQEYKITVLSPSFAKCRAVEEMQSVTYIRLGKKRANSKSTFNLGMYLAVFRYYQKHIRNRYKYHMVIEEVNPFPFLFSLYGNTKSILLVEKLGGREWFNVFPWYLSWAGYLFLEPFYLFLMRGREVITFSDQIKKRLLKFGFQGDRVHVVPSILLKNPKQLYFHLLCILENIPQVETAPRPLKLRRFSYIK